jgi:hypothetical protein
MPHACPRCSGPSDVQIFCWGADDRYSLPLDLQHILLDQFAESPHILSEPDVILK